MKSRIIKIEESKKFKPFKLELEIETTLDARGLLYILNSENYLSPNMYLEDSEVEIYAKILKELKDQGFI